MECVLSGSTFIVKYEGKITRNSSISYFILLLVLTLTKVETTFYRALFLYTHMCIGKEESTGLRRKVIRTG